MSDRDQVLTDVEITARHRELEESGAGPGERLEFALSMYRFQRGPAAEEVVRSVLSSLPVELLEPWVRDDVIGDKALGTVNYCQSEWTDTLATHLIEQGIHVDQEGGVWRVSWAAGELLTGEELCRLALQATWLRKMSGMPGV